MVPRRNLGVYLEERERNQLQVGGQQGGVLSAVYERDEDFS
jgi:hypothetical protein